VTKIIPNEEAWIGFAATLANYQAPKAAEVAAAVDLTDYIVSINAGTQGNTVPIPDLGHLFESSINGTAAAQFTASMYRDDEDDLAWNTLPRRTNGFMLISRFGGTGASNSPAIGQSVEVWPVSVTSRSADQLTSNTAQTFALTCSVPQEPAEDAIVVA
jgi:hypothetical protein